MAELNFWEYKMVQPPWKMVWQFLKKLPPAPAILLLGIYLKEAKAGFEQIFAYPCSYKDYLH
jgi:hypothetical protein